MPYKNRAERKELGLCRDCTNPVKPFYSRCEKCLENDRAGAHTRMIKIRKNRLKNNLCHSCGRPLHIDMDKGRINCMKCREAYKWR